MSSSSFKILEIFMGRWPQNKLQEFPRAKTVLPRSYSVKKKVESSRSDKCLWKAAITSPTSRVGFQKCIETIALWKLNP